MMCRFLLACWFAVLSQAFLSAPGLVQIQWRGVVAKSMFLTPSMIPPHNLQLRNQHGMSEVPRFSVRPDGSIRMDAIGSRLCLEASSDQENLETVRVNHCTGGANQLWNLLPTGRGREQRIQLKDTQKCVNVNSKEGDLNEAAVDLQDCNNAVTGLWSLEEQKSPSTQKPSQSFASSSPSLRYVGISCIAFAWLAVLSLTAWVWRRQKQAPIPVDGAGDRGGVCLTEPRGLLQNSLAADVEVASRILHEWPESANLHKTRSPHPVMFQGDRAAEVGTPLSTAAKQQVVGILLIDHGSRRSSSNDRLHTYADMLQSQVDSVPADQQLCKYVVRASHMEIATPTIYDGMKELTEEGVDAIVCHPYFLSPGRHIQEDIPQLIDEAIERLNQERGSEGVPNVITTDPVGSRLKSMVNLSGSIVQDALIENGIVDEAAAATPKLENLTQQIVEDPRSRAPAMTLAVSSWNKSTSWPPCVQGMDLAFDQLQNHYNFMDYLTGKPLELISRAVDGDLTALAGAPLFQLLEKYYRDVGPIFTLDFAGFKTFTVVSDPVIAKHILKNQHERYNKGMLSEILEDIMGQGLIPARNEIWKTRRRAIVPAFHGKWLKAMMKVFAQCNAPLIDKLDRACVSGEAIEMETEFTSVTLDIIGKAVFNYEFGSVEKVSPVVKAVYSVLQEAERRSTSVVPYWQLPFAAEFNENFRKFQVDMAMLNSILNDLIEQAFDTQEEADAEELQSRDYDNIENLSLLRFLVDMRGEEATGSQLRDDLMTMLIAGHETTAAVLTWTMFELSQNPALFAMVRAEVDEVLEGRAPTHEDISKLKLVRLCIAETLRMYPEPPLLVRRSLVEDELPAGGAERKTVIPKGTDVIISTWNLHRSPLFWEDPEVYNPHRFLKSFSNPGQEDWGGRTPLGPKKNYPTEDTADFAFMPFGGGARRCVGDQFAMMESVVTLSLLLQRFDFTLDIAPGDVGMRTGATIHTENGLPMKISRRQVA